VTEIADLVKLNRQKMPKPLPFSNGPGVGMLYDRTSGRFEEVSLSRPALSERESQQAAAKRRSELVERSFAHVCETGEPAPVQKSHHSGQAVKPVSVLLLVGDFNTETQYLLRELRSKVTVKLQKRDRAGM
jgi:hypothetical protein